MVFNISEFPELREQRIHRQVEASDELCLSNCLPTYIGMQIL